MGRRVREWMESLETQKLKPIFEPWLIVDDQFLKDRIERRLIKTYGAQLLNTKPGGQGGAYGRKRKVEPIHITEDL